MSTVKWQEPPAPQGGPSGKARWDEIARELHARPGQWALIEEATSNSHGLLQCKDRGLERTIRSRPDGKYDVYARAEVSA